MDVVGADFGNALEEIRERLEGRPLALTIPIGSGSVKDSATPFRAIIDLIEMNAIYFDEASLGKKFRTEPIPEALQAEAESWRAQLFDRLTEHDPDDRITSAVLEGKPVASSNIRALIREQTLKGLIQPVLCGSGREHIGIQLLLDAVCWYLPSPLDRPPVTGANPRKEGKEEKRKPDPKEPFCGLVFKIVADSSSQLFYVRIYSGTLRSNSRIWNPGRDAKELVAKIYHVHADPGRRDDLPEAYAGDIVAILGLKESVTGDTLCETQHPILLEPIHFAEAVVSRSIEPMSSADKQKLVDTLDLLRKEDPTFEWKVDTETGQTLMSGMGLLHLEIKQHRMERDFRLKVRVGKPHVSFRETIREPRVAVGECIRQTGTSGLFAKVQVEFKPHNDPQHSIVVDRRIKPEILLPLHLHAAEQGIRGALSSGEMGFPVMNVRATIVGGEMDVQLSNEIAFQAAAADAVHQAMRDNIVLLEPMMELEVTVPEEFLGPITSDLNARRAEITQVHARGKLMVIEALVPLRRMFDYVDKVRSLSQGRASWTMEPHAYAPAPDEVLQSLLQGSDTW
jgi:elongation factor G